MNNLLNEILQDIKLNTPTRVISKNQDTEEYDVLYMKIKPYLKETGSSLHAVQYEAVLEGIRYRMYSTISGEMFEEIEIFSFLA